MLPSQQLGREDGIFPFGCPAQTMGPQRYDLRQTMDAAEAWWHCLQSDYLNGENPYKQFFLFLSRVFVVFVYFY